MTVEAVEETDSGDSVRHGRVQNAREVSIRVSEIIRRLENSPRLTGGRITQVFVSDGGRSVVSRQASSEMNLGGEAEITPRELEKLHNEARYNLATDRDVLAISDRRFVVDNTEVKKIIGTFGNVVRGEFTIVTASPENRRNLDRVKIESHEADIPRRYIPRTIALAEMVLSDSERQLGTLLIDFGAETTTLAIYRANALQLMATLPMGSANITRDLSAGLGVTEEAAERIKITKGRAVADRVKNVESDPDSAEITNYISARAGEIIANVINYIDKEGQRLSDLTGGIVITGGGAQLPGLDAMLESQTHLSVRHAAIDSTIANAPRDNATAVDVIAIVRYAASVFPDINCMVLPEAPSPTATQSAAAAAPAVAAAAAATAAMAGARPGRRNIAENDPRLLKDDDLDDEIIDQPDNINDEDDELPPPGTDAASTRISLIKRLTNWITRPVEDNSLDEENE